MNVVELRGGAALESLRDEWEALVERSERATIYQTWEWNEAWWRVFHRGKRLRLLLVRDNNALIGLAPFYISAHLGTPLRRLAFLGTGASDYLDILAPESRAPEVSYAILRFLDTARDFDLADLQQMRSKALLREEAERLPLSPILSRRISFSPQETCPCISLPSSWEEYAARLSGNMRSQLSRRGKQARKDLPEFEMRLAEMNDLPDAMTSLFDLHQRRWNERLLPGVLGGAKTQTFHRLVAQRFQKRGWLRLHFTRVEGRAAAALYCFRFRERYYYYLGGFDPALSRYSLGTLLMAQAIRQAIDEECAEFDFLRGDEDYKYRWLPEDRINHRLLVMHPRSLRSHAMLRLNHLERYVERRAKAFAERRGRSRTE